jgi:putative tryptophan/tyrosine transport system substrate-binding protein
MRRRDFIKAIAGTATVWPLAVRAQQSTTPVIGFLDVRSPDVDADLVVAVRAGLAETGHVEGQNLRIEYRWADGAISRLPELADDLVQRHVSLIMAGGNAAAPAAKAATATIPIVFSTGDDPVKVGLVDSLSHPGGNLTGVTSFARENVTKRLGVLLELVPKVSTIALLTNPDDPTGGIQTSDAEAAAGAIGRQLLELRARSEHEIDVAFATMVERQVGALLVSSDAFLRSRRNQIIGLASGQALPTMFNVRQDAVAGGLISYGADFVDGYRKVGDYAGRILNGTKPSDLPVQQPTKFQLIINLKTAKNTGTGCPTVPTRHRRRGDRIDGPTVE